MKLKPILDVVDFSRDFVDPAGELHVIGAEETVSLAHYFLQKVRFSVAVLKNDTHFEGEYKHSDEALSFGFHQGFGTKGHEYLLDTSAIQADHVLWLLKNKFDMWAPNSNVNVPFEQIEFKNAEERRVYQGLFHMANIDENGRYVFGEERDAYYKRLYDLGHRDVVLFGHATDYCVRDAILGYLERGFTVDLIEDLCRGIWNTALLGGVANIEELVARCPEPDYVNGTVMDRTVFKDAVANGTLIVTNTQEYIARFNKV
ncbi:MAG: hypothetical protein CMF61_03090 [Magnetococcales bacterium]|nr:hypothetical protein [Magnetococcales bacterium]